MHAVIETGGKQYRVCEGDTLFIEKLDAQAGQEVKFDRVLAIMSGETTNFGTPTVDGAVVTAEVLKNGKAKKVIVYKMKPKKNYRRKQGHRQPYTQVKISKITV
ncbi:MAG: 50S ribosomal protein L21 [Oscillospiraceae bacterium]|nr:50S ribosomal protein L21 [Oscillospiraceae bacterium]